MISVLIDFGVEDVKERAFDTEFIFKLFAGSKQMVNVAGRIGIGALDVGGKNNGKVGTHVLSELDNAFGLLGKLGIFLVRVFGIMPVVIKSLFVGESVIKAVDSDNGNVFISVGRGKFFNGVGDLSKSIDRKEIFLFAVVMLFETAPRQCAFAVNIEDNGGVRVERFESKGFTGGGLSVN